MRQSELLRKQADMLDMAQQYGVDDWRKLVQFRHNDGWVPLTGAALNMHTTWNYRFALSVVEGKPVFEGDVLQYRGREFVIVDSSFEYSLPEHWSWVLPKPKTVTVELLYADAVHWAGYSTNNTHPQSVRLYEACRKALEDPQP